MEKGRLEAFELVAREGGQESKGLGERGWSAEWKLERCLKWGGMVASRDVGGGRRSID